MKKSNIALIILEILLIVTVACGPLFNGLPTKSIDTLVQKELGENQAPSLNYLLKYNMLEGYEDALNLYGEVAITTEDNNSTFTMDILDTKKTSPEQFFKAQEEVFQQSANFTLVSENTSNENDRTINKKIYEVSNDFSQFYAFVGTIEIKGHSKDFIAIIGTATSLDYSDNFDILLSTTDYTKQKSNKAKLFSDELEATTVVVPANWKRLERAVPYSFYKQDNANMAYVIASSANKNEKNPQENYNFAKESLSSDPSASLKEDSKVETIDNKTFTTSVIEYKDSYITTILTLIEFKDSDVFSIVRTDVISENGIGYIQPEIDSIIKSINLKQN